MEFTFELGAQYGVLPFEILKQDKDDVILLINYLIEKSERNGAGSGEAIQTEEKTQDKAFWAAL